MLAVGDVGLKLSSKMTSIETTSMMSVVGLSISQLRIFLRILRYKLVVKIFELEYKMKELCREMVSQQFGKYCYIHEVLDMIQFQFL